MNGKYVHTGLLLGVMGLLTACASINQSTPKDTGELRAEMASLYDLMRASQMLAAQQKVNVIVRSPGFADLNEMERYRVLMIGGSIAGSRQEYERAYTFYKNATALSIADARAFKSRGDAARFVGNLVDATDSMMVAFEKWPREWVKRDEDVLFDVSRRMFATERHQAQYEFLNRIYSAGFTATTGEEPSGLWQELVRLLLEKKEVSRAATVAGRVTHPYVLLNMRIDREFDVLRESNPAPLEVGNAASDRAGRAKKLVEKSPNSMEAQKSYLNALYGAGRYDELIPAADAVIEKSRSEEGRASLDEPDELAWILDYKSRALFALDRENEAIEALQAASRVPERGGVNVSHTINLAFAYCNAGRYREALNAVDQVGSASPYGRMQVMVARHCAARGLGDKGEIDRTFAYVKDQKNDSPLDYLELLILNDRLNEAANYLVAMLGSEERKTAALLRLQSFEIPVHIPEETRLIDVRLAEIASRRQVKAAIEKAGRIETFTISRPAR